MVWKGDGPQWTLCGGFGQGEPGKHTEGERKGDDPSAAHTRRILPVKQPIPQLN